MTADESPDPLAELSMADLESRLCTLSARIAAAECEFLTLLAEFDARQGWGESGMKSAAHWLSWRTGMRLGVARERLRVARSLRCLPLIREAFAAGRLSYCKVRALSRVATPPTEPDLVEIALGATGAQLERFARAWRTCLIGETSASSHLRRGLTRREEEDGSVVYTLRVPPEASAVVDAAVAVARQGVLDADGRPVETPEETALAEAVTGEPASRRADSDAFVLMAQAFLAGSSSADTADRTTVVVHTDLAGLAAALDDESTVHTSTSTSTSTAPVPIPDGGSVAARSLAARPSGAVLDTGARLAMSSVVRMLCDSPVQLMVHAADGRPLDLGRTRRHASPGQRRALHSRDGGCRFPGCTQQRRLIPHHVHWWSRDGLTDMDNLVLLCPTHHRAVHEIGYTVDALGDGCFAFRMPGGQRLPGPGPEPAGLTDAGAADVTVVIDVPVGPDTIVPTWGGERLDLDMLVGGLAGNLLNLPGHLLADVPYPDLGPALRQAAQWPMPTPPLPRVVTAA